MKKQIVKNLVKTLLLMASLPALAQKPTIQFLPFPTAGVVAPTASLCGFDILATPQAGRPNGARIILFDNTGIMVGTLFLTLKNLSSGKTVDVNVSGPALLTFSDTTTTIVGMGPGIFLLPPLPASVTTAAGLPPVPLLRGRAVFTVDNQGNVTSFQSITGTAEDVCQLLR
jgi:hypothetical protein